MRYSAFALFLNGLRGNKAWSARLAHARAEAALRCRDRRRRRAWAGDRLLSRQGVRHHQRRGAGEGLYRFRQCRPQHHHHPLQLPAARQQSVLRALAEALGRAGAGLQLQRHGVAARHPQPLPFRRASATPMPGAATPCGCTASTPSCSTGQRCGAMLPFLNFDDARFPIQGGLLQRRGGTVRHDAVAWGYARGADMRGVDIIQHCEVTGIRREDGRVAGVETHARLRSRQASSGSRSPAIHRGSPRWPASPADREPCAAGLCQRRAEAVRRHRRHLRRRALLLLPVRQGRPRFRRRHRRLQFLRAAGQPRRGRACAGSRRRPDSRPVAGARPAVLGRRRWTCPWTARRSSTDAGDNLYLNAGWCYGGFKATPASGFCFAHLIARNEPHAGRAAFRLDRFARGAADRRKGRRRPAQSALRGHGEPDRLPALRSRPKEEFSDQGDASLRGPPPMRRPDGPGSTMSICATIRAAAIASTGIMRRGCRALAGGRRATRSPMRSRGSRRRDRGARA